MKTFLYILTAARNAKKDGVHVVGGIQYFCDQLLLVIRARNVEHAAWALNTKVLSSFDRSSVNCPTIHYTSDPNEDGDREKRPSKEATYFYFSLKEPEPSDERKFTNLKDRMRFKITAPPRPRKKKALAEVQ